MLFARTRLTYAALTTVTVTVALAASAAALPGDPPGSSADRVAASSGTPVRHVVAVSVDGLNPRAIRQLGRENLPTLHRLMRNGAWTLNARTAYERTRTLPNHAGMMTGRGVATSAGGHGVWFNNDNTGTTVHRAAGEYVHSVFDVVHDHGGSTALFTGKDKFALYDRTWDAENGGPDTVGGDDGNDKIDRFEYTTDRRVVRAAAQELDGSTPRDLTFVHLAGPDKAGHASGYLGADYLAAVVRADRQVGRIVNTIRRNASRRADTVVILTSDHGGKGFSHEDETRRYNYTVPFVVWGADVDRGVNLYRINPDYRNPGRTRPGYDAPDQPVRNADLANLATDLLGLPAVPNSTVNPGQGLRVTR